MNIKGFWADRGFLVMFWPAVKLPGIGLNG